MRVLVTGAAGRLGWYTVTGLHQAGHEVVATDVLYNPDLPVRLRVVDLLDRNAAYALLEGCEAVVHLGNHSNQYACSPVQRLYTENVTMTMNVVQAAMDMAIRKVVFASSIQAACSQRAVQFPVEGEQSKSLLAHLPFDSATPTAPGNHYALSKEASERMLDMFSRWHDDLSATSIRFPALLSEEDMRYRRRFGAGGYPVFLDEGFAYLRFEEAASLIDHVLRKNLPGHKVVMPSANDNRLGLCAADLLKLLYQGVPLRKPIAPDARTVFDLAEIKTLYGWEPTMTSPHFELMPELQKILQDKLAAAE